MNIFVLKLYLCLNCYISNHSRKKKKITILNYPRPYHFLSPQLCSSSLYLNSHVLFSFSLIVNAQTEVTEKVAIR